MSTNGIPLYPTICHICGKKINDCPALNIPIVGQLDKQVMQYIALLQKHLTKFPPNDPHSQAMMGVIGAVQELTGVLLLSHFELSDPTLKARANFARAHFISQFAVLTDDATVSKLVAAVCDTAPADQLRAQLTELIRDLRDLWTERGKYAPAVQPSNVITMSR